jgi:hypothetical protein
MTKRFASLLTLGLLVINLIPVTAQAQIQSKTPSLEIKNIPAIPTVHELSELINGTKKDENIEVETVEVAMIEVEEVVILPTPPPPGYQIPPRVAEDKRVYMHEPEIRAYICPRMGQEQCNIFVAVLKAENGTHECTRDNRGLNKNGSVDVGLAQINWNPLYNPPYTIENLRDCEFNLDIALKKYEARGFQPWYAYTKGAYKRFLTVQ